MGAAVVVVVGAAVVVVGAAVVVVGGTVVVVVAIVVVDEAPGIEVAVSPAPSIVGSAPIRLLVVL